MALEDKLVELIDALNRNTAVTENLMNLRAQTIEEIKGAAKPATKSTEKTPTTSDTPKPNISETPEDRKDPETGGSDPYENLGKVISEFVGMDDNAELRDERAAIVKKLFGHDKIKAANHKEVPEPMIPVVIANIEKVAPDFKKKSDAAKAATTTGSDDLLGG